jgi:hypothetical protein
VLQQQLEDFLSQERHVETSPKALIVPHAGYIYSGPVAAIRSAVCWRLPAITTCRLKPWICVTPEIPPEAGTGW